MSRTGNRELLLNINIFENPRIVLEFWLVSWNLSIETNLNLNSRASPYLSRNGCAWLFRSPVSSFSPWVMLTRHVKVTCLSLSSMSILIVKRVSLVLLVNLCYDKPKKKVNLCFAVVWIPFDPESGKLSLWSNISLLCRNLGELGSACKYLYSWRFQIICELTHAISVVFKLSQLELSFSLVQSSLVF